MKKKVLIGLISIIVILAIGVLGYNISDFSYLTTMKGDIATVESSSSEVKFIMKKDEKIKFEFKSIVENGTLNFTLTDSKGRLIKNFENNKEYTEELQLEKGEEYRLLAQYVDFSGSFSAKCK